MSSPIPKIVGINMALSDVSISYFVISVSEFRNSGSVISLAINKAFNKRICFSFSKSPLLKFFYGTYAPDIVAEYHVLPTFEKNSIWTIIVFILTR